jgi:hypothetical protein
MIRAIVGRVRAAPARISRCLAFLAGASWGAIDWTIEVMARRHKCRGWKR